MKTLVVYFSKTGNTKKVAEKIAKNLKADLDEIIDVNNVGEESVMKKELIEISHKKDPARYDLVVIGSPVWGFSIPPPTKSYMKRNKFGKVAFFATYALMTGTLFMSMKKLSKKPISKLKIHAKKIKDSDKKILEFCSFLDRDDN